MRNTLPGAVVAVLISSVVLTGIPSARGPDSSAAGPVQVTPASRLGDLVRDSHEGLVKLLAGTNDGRTLSAGERSRRLTALMAQIKAVERLVPRETFDLEVVAAPLGRDPARFHQWVRQHTTKVPYRGALRGAKGTLMDRRGNSLDRSLLLAGLLSIRDIQVRLARAQLTAAQLSSLAKPAVVTPVKDATTDENILRSIDGFAKQTGADAGRIRQQLQLTVQASREAVEHLRSRVTAQTATIVKGLGMTPPPSDPSSSSALEALQDHWWVQWEDGSEWRDLDPDLAAPGKAITAPEETIDPTALPDDLHHSIHVRVVVERWDGSTLEAEPAISVDLRPSEELGESVRLQHVPIGWPKEFKGAEPERQRQIKDAALKLQEWQPVFTIGQRRITGPSVLDTGDLNSQPGSKPGARPGGIADALGAGASGPGLLTAEWIEYEIRSPGRETRIIRRDVFDLVGPSARAAGRGPTPLTDQARLSRSLSLLGETEILPLGSQLSAAFVMHLAVSRFLAAEPLLASLTGGQTPVPQDLAPLPGLLHGLAVARGDSARAAHTVYLEAPNVVSQHTFPHLDAAGKIGLATAFDIVANEVGAIDLAPRDRFTLRVEQGVLDANLEAMVLGSTAGSTADLFGGNDSSRDWVAVRTVEDLAKLKTTPDIKARLEADVRNGFMVFTPRASEASTIWWWRVDPHTGDTLSFGHRGWGQAQVESILVNTLVGGVGISSVCLLGMGVMGVEMTNRVIGLCIMAGATVFSTGAMAVGAAVGGTLGSLTVGLAAWQTILSGASTGYMAAVLALQ